MEIKELNADEPIKATEIVVRKASLLKGIVSFGLEYVFQNSEGKYCGDQFCKVEYLLHVNGKKEKLNEEDVEKYIEKILHEPDKGKYYFKLKIPCVITVVIFTEKKYDSKIKGEYGKLQFKKQKFEEIINYTEFEKKTIEKEKEKCAERYVSLTNKLKIDVEHLETLVKIENEKVKAFEDEIEIEREKIK